MSAQLLETATSPKADKTAADQVVRGGEGVAGKVRIGQGVVSEGDVGKGEGRGEGVDWGERHF